ncbi:MAG: ice-binding family protein [Bacteroidota bacterium]
MKNKLLLIIFVGTFSFVTNIISGQAPDLGTSSSFALFTSTGAFDNLRETKVTGDIGTNIGALTGFPSPGTVVGEIHVVDLTSAQAANDLEIAYSQLFALACDSTIGTTLGNNKVLPPHIYCLGAASLLTGDLILDGKGDPDAIFIFKIDGALSTSINSNVILINLASFNNVYWQINGAFELGDSSVFRGIIIASGAISLLDSSSLEGNGLSRGGAISLNNNNVTLGSLSLPIELLNFNVSPVGENVLLEWSTASETNNDFFTVQRSKDGLIFNELTKVQGAGSSNTIIFYSTIDYNHIENTSYYRLKQTDFDGKYSYSKTEFLNFVEITMDTFFINPNPFCTFLTIRINDASEINNYDLIILNALGEEFVNTNIEEQLKTVKTDNLPSGMYFYKLSNNNIIIQTGSLVSQ